MYSRFHHPRELRGVPLATLPFLPLLPHKMRAITATVRVRNLKY
jgi:hypothetical protein